MGGKRSYGMIRRFDHRPVRISDIPEPVRFSCAPCIRHLRITCLDDIPLIHAFPDIVQAHMPDIVRAHACEIKLIFGEDISHIAEIVDQVIIRITVPGIIFMDAASCIRGKILRIAASAASCQTVEIIFIGISAEHSLSGKVFGCIHHGIHPGDIGIAGS